MRTPRLLFFSTPTAFIVHVDFKLDMKDTSDTRMYTYSFYDFFHCASTSHSKTLDSDHLIQKSLMLKPCSLMITSFFSKSAPSRKIFYSLCQVHWPPPHSLHLSIPPSLIFVPFSSLQAVKNFMIFYCKQLQPLHLPQLHLPIEILILDENEENILVSLS